MEVSHTHVFRFKHIEFTFFDKIRNIYFMPEYLYWPIEREIVVTTPNIFFYQRSSFSRGITL